MMAAAELRPRKRQRQEDHRHMSNFLTFLSKHKAIIHPSITFCNNDQWGLHCVAKTKINAGTPLFTLPLHLCLTSTSAQEHSVLGPILSELRTTSTLSNLEYDRAMVYCLLLYEKSIPSSIFAPYISMLPTSEILEERVATFTTSNSDTTKVQLLAGTHIATSIIPQHLATLEIIDKEITSILERRLSTKPNVFSRKMLTWAAGIFHSRAIMIPTQSGDKTSRTRQEALTPLVDILNHRPGYLSHLNRSSLTKQKTVLSSSSSSSSSSFSSSSSSSSSTTTSTSPGAALTLKTTTTVEAKEKTDDVMVYKVGRAIQPNEQIFLNYGPKANEDLLSHFGFTLSKNVCDVLHIDIQGQRDDDNDDDKGKGGTHNLILYENCSLAKTLDACRASSVIDQSQHTTTVSITTSAAIYGCVGNTGDGNGSGSGHEDEDEGSSSRWFAQMLKAENDPDTPVMIDLSLENIGTPISKNNERCALELLENILVPIESWVIETPPDSSDNLSLCFKSDVEEYKRGQQFVAISVLLKIRALKKLLIE